MYDSSDVWEGGLDGSDEAAIKAAQTTMTTKNIQDVVTEFNRQLELGIKVGVKNPEIAAFIGAWDKYDAEVNDCPLTSQDGKVMQELLRTYSQKLVEVTRVEERERLLRLFSHKEYIKRNDLVDALTPPTSDVEK